MLLCFASSDWRYLSATRSNDVRAFNVHEVNCAPQQFAWKLQVYDDTTLDESKVRCGNPLQLYIKATDGFLAGKFDISDEIADEVCMSTRTLLCVYVHERMSQRACAAPMAHQVGFSPKKRSSTVSRVFPVSFVSAPPPLPIGFFGEGVEFLFYLGFCVPFSVEIVSMAKLCACFSTDCDCPLHTFIMHHKVTQQLTTPMISSCATASLTFPTII